MKNAVFIAFFAFASALFTALQLQAAELDGVRFGPGAGKTRIVLDISGSAGHNLSGDDLGNGRLFVDFNKLSVPPTALALQPGMGHVASYQFVPKAGGAMRAVLTFKKTAKIAESFVIAPSGKVKHHRLVIDLVDGDKAAFLASIPAQYPDLGPVIERATGPGVTDVTPVAQPKREVAIPPSKRVIVVDAGHGGKDPGAVGQDGTLEKTVTLKAAVVLREILEETGRYEVVLTHNSDNDPRLIPNQAKELARREALAREANAALFISLHADALGDHSVRGGSVYTLSDKGTKRSTQLAKSEGNYTVYQLDTREFQDHEYVGDILFDVATNKTNTASSRFAQDLLDELAGKTPLLNRSHRKGDLRVLLAPDVPAVLFEMAYISNKSDEANLNSSAWRRRTMKAVARAIDKYFEDIQPQYAQTGGAGGN